MTKIAAILALALAACTDPIDLPAEPDAGQDAPPAAFAGDGEWRVVMTCRGAAGMCALADATAASINGRAGSVRWTGAGVDLTHRGVVEGACLVFEDEMSGAVGRDDYTVCPAGGGFAATIAWADAAGAVCSCDAMLSR